MAIPFYEPNEQQALHQQQHQPSQQQQQLHEEVDQVDGHVMSNPPNVANTEMPSPNSPPPPPPTTEDDVTAWKLLALAMCKALKDHYQQNLATSSSNSSTAVIQILPNGQVKPSWN